MNDHPTTFIASAAITSHWWLPALKTWSEVAALLLPIAGVLWLVIQIATHVFKNVKED